MGTGSTREAGVYRSTNRGASWTQVASYVWYDAIRISDKYEADGTVLAVSWSGGLDVTTNRGLVFGSMSSGIPLVSGKYWGNALDISPSFSTDGVVYVGLTNGGVFTTYQSLKTRVTTVELVIGSTTMIVNGSRAGTGRGSDDHGWQDAGAHTGHRRGYRRHRHL